MSSEITPKHSRLAIVALLFGTWLTADALSALLTNKYLIESAAWQDMLGNVNINFYEFAPAILSLGMLWLVSGITIITKHRWWRGFYGTTAVLSLWYLPIGTFIGLVALSVILSGLLPRQKQRHRIIIVSIALSAIVTFGLLELINLQGAN